MYTSYRKSHIVNVNESVAISDDQICTSNVEKKFHFSEIKKQDINITSSLFSNTEKCISEIQTVLGCCVSVVGFTHKNGKQVGTMNHILGESDVELLINQTNKDLTENFDISLLDFPELLVLGGHQLVDKDIHYGQRTLDKVQSYLRHIGYPQYRIKVISEPELKKNQGSFVRLVLKGDGMGLESAGEVYYRNTHDPLFQKTNISKIKVSKN